MRFAVFFLTLFIACGLVQAQTTRPVPKIGRALIFSVDGLRPDVLLRSDAPNIRALIDRGSFSFWARSTPQSLTLPTHVSLLTGATVEVHSISWNGELPFSKPVYPNAPTLFELAKKAGFTTALVAAKSKFAILNKPGSIDYFDVPKASKGEDQDAADEAIRLLRSHQPEVMFVHFANVDVVGHATGWGTPEQVTAVAAADQCVGHVLATLRDLGLEDSTVVVLTADHGGAGRTHGADDVRSRHIPWIIAGPGIRKGYDLTMNRDLVIDIYDTFTTICTLLDIPMTRKVAGKFIEDVLVDRELLRSSDAGKK